MILLLATYLEMTEPPAERASTLPEGVAIGRESLAVADYLRLYTIIGAPQRWDSRLKLDPAQLRRVIDRPDNDIHVLRVNAEPAGFLEIDRAGAPDFEVTHFGIVPDHQGRGLGSLLLSTGLSRAWKLGPRRIWLHTDEWDHPNALATYQKAGFRITRQVREDVTDF